LYNPGIDNGGVLEKGDDVRKQIDEDATKMKLLEAMET
jgi:hypothetical protein